MKLPQNTSICICRSQVVLKKSCSKENNGRMYYSCPNAKGRHFGCGFFSWADEPQEAGTSSSSPGPSSSSIRRGSRSSPGPSSNCVNYKLLTAKIMVLEAELMMARGHEYSSQSAAALQEISAQLDGLIVQDEVKQKIEPFFPGLHVNDASHSSSSKPQSILTAETSLGNSPDLNVRCNKGAHQKAGESNPVTTSFNKALESYGEISQCLQNAHVESPSVLNQNPNLESWESPSTHNKVKVYPLMPNMTFPRGTAAFTSPFPGPLSSNVKETERSLAGTSQPAENDLEARKPTKESSKLDIGA